LGHKQIFLYSIPGRESFYEKFGFKKMNTAMAIFSNLEQAIDIGLVNET